MMAQVVVVIAGRTYRMNCADGEEPHIEMLAGQLDARMEELRAGFGEIGEQRLTMMTALTIVDELHEIRQKLARAERDLAFLREEGAAAETRAADDRKTLAARLDGASARIETLAEAFRAKG